MELVNCQKCPRLVAWREKVAKEKVRRFADYEYWGKPVPSFGDKNARLFIVGLAPGAHGANRTGRMFTGDRSGEWLYEALWRFGFASRPESLHKDDGLQLYDCYISAVLHCVPPQNKPTTREIQNCLPYLQKELRTMKQVKVILTLGQIAYKNTLKTLGIKGEKFKHELLLSYKNRYILASYHPSQQNTFTKRLTREMWYSVFAKARELLSENQGNS